MEFTCFVEVRHPKGTDEDFGGHVLDAVEGGELIGVAASQNLVQGTIGIRYNVDATDANRAISAGLRVLRAAIGVKRLAPGSVVALEAEPYIDPEQNELVSQAEIARRLGISRQRVKQLVEERKDFPAPAQTLAGPRGTLWRWGGIDAWNNAVERRTGRPKTKRSPTEVEGFRSRNARSTSAHRGRRERS